MKRSSLLGLAAVIICGFAASGAAQAACINADGTVGNGTWPSHQFTQKCGTSTVAHGTDMFSAFSPWFANDATDRLTFQAPKFYLFNDPAEFQAAGIVPAEVYVGPTVDLGNSFIPGGYTVVVEDTNVSGGTVQSNYEIPNVTAHEAGHWVDYLYEHAPNAVYITVGGVAHTGDTVSVIVHNTHLVGGVETATYTVGSEDALKDIATGLAAAVANDVKLNTATVHVTASSSNTNVSVSAVLINGADISTYTTAGTTYTFSKSAGATETLAGTIGVLPASTAIDASDSVLWADELAQDWTNFNALSPCAVGGGIFTNRQDENLVYFCTGATGFWGSLIAKYAPGGVPMSNKAILQLVYPDIFKPDANGHTHELFAEEFANLVGKQDSNYSENGPGNPPVPQSGSQNPRSRDYYLGAQDSFQCTQNIIIRMTSTGVLPSGYGGNCPNH